MKPILTAVFFYLSLFQVSAQSVDTTFVDASNLRIKDLRLGRQTFLIYSKKRTDGPVQNQTLVVINVAAEEKEGAKKITIDQRWYDKDTLSHTSTSVLSAVDLRTLHHTYWWKRTGQNVALNFENKTAEQSGKATENQREKFQKDFAMAAQSGYFLNWHCDLVLFPLFPFKENTVFKVKFHDPGLGLPTTELYKVTKSEKIEGIDCWVLEYTLPRNMGYQRFWVAKKAKTVLKEEDSFNGMYRFKLKMTVSE
ncbi:hypothetical protein FHS57_005784 [Runella defluvii]|uniref:DUF3108 domain-containing protein n=1 Tax=Runella defluvii TaxID=370973 RepID=A0A7W6ETE2_9BACT|nr:hypothetical protein [Runella defluvii]MBB3841755.1 hypothetical protein [Runella defluvii]